jgi:hypothetical protein
MNNRKRNLIVLAIAVLAGAFLVIGTQRSEALVVLRTGIQVCLGCIGIG